MAKHKKNEITPSLRNKYGKRKELVDNPRAELRLCLKCDREFLSEGIGNRVCGYCKNLNEAVSHRGWGVQRIWDR